MTLAKLMKVTAMLLVLGTVAFGSEPPVLHAVADEKMTDSNYGMFPDGRNCDFGKVPRGTPVKLSFRIVNTSNVTLTLTSIRIS